MKFFARDVYIYAYRDTIFVATLPQRLENKTGEQIGDTERQRVERVASARWRHCERGFASRGGLLSDKRTNPNTPNLSLIHISEPTRPY